MNDLSSAGTGRAPRRRALGAAVLLACSGLATTAAVAQEGDAARNQWPQPGATASPGVTRAAPEGGPGGLTLHPSLPAFHAATQSMEIRFEDFSGGFANPGTPMDCFQALGSDSDDACFGPGDLVPGFAVRSSRGSIFGEGGDSDIVTLGPFFLGTPSRVVGAYQSFGATHISFDPGVVAVAMDVYDGIAAQPVSITAFDAAEVQIGTFTVTPTALNEGVFAGFTSNTPVHRIELDTIVDGGAELIGNLRFGGRAGRLSVAGEAVDFGTVAIGAGAQAEVELVNDGDLPLVLSTLPAAGPAFAWVGGNCTGTTLQPGASCAAQLRFDPPHEGLFDTGALADWTEAFAIRGNGHLTRLTPSPGHVEFGQVAAGSQSPVHTVQLANLDGADAVVESIATRGPFVRVGGNCEPAPFLLSPGQLCTLDYRFVPVSAGDYAGRVDISTAGETVTRIGLTGRTGSP